MPPLVAPRFTHAEKQPASSIHYIESKSRPLVPLWREIQNKNFKKWEDLFAFLQLEQIHCAKVLKTPRFSLNLPLRLAQKISKNNWEDPILKQFLPTFEENKIAEGFSLDPDKDTAFQIQKKLLKKYKHRALLLTSSACAMHCRFCFRQNFPYEKQIKGFEKELQEIREDRTLSEIILSGGDPLSLSNTSLKDLLQSLDTISHVKRVRFHTRFPLGIPERLDDEFLTILARLRLQIFFIIHCNHPQELDTDILHALKKVQRLGIPVMNQAVLLKGVNDDMVTLRELCTTLVNHGILPYYLHQLDKVQQAAHFEVDTAVGKQLIDELMQEISGYGVPRYVAELPGEPSKTLL